MLNNCQSNEVMNQINIILKVFSYIKQVGTQSVFRFKYCYFDFP